MENSGVSFDAGKEWAILLPPDIPEAKKAAADLARYIGLLAERSQPSVRGQARKQPVLLDATGPAPGSRISTIALNSDANGPERNGFIWRARPERVEIYGESGRGLCNGIYSFLASLGISWPAPGQEKLPTSAVNNSRSYLLSAAEDCELSDHAEKDPATVPWRRFVPAGKDEAKKILKRGEAFAAWAARLRYDALIFPLAAFVSGYTGQKLRELGKYAGEYGIVLEAGGRDLSSLVPRKYFFIHPDFFRMEKGKRKKAHHFCPTNPGVIQLIGREGGRLFRSAAAVKVFHLWPDKGAEKIWCSCPCCRAFTPPEQNRIAVNAARDILSAQNPSAALTFYEKSGEGGNIPLRKNVFRMEKLPDEKQFGEQ